MSKLATSITEDVKPSADSKTVTESDLLASRLNARKAQVEEEPKAEAEETDDTETEAEVEQTERVEEKAEAKEETETSEAKAETVNADVLSKFDLDKLTEAELNALAEKTRSKAISRYGELTADKKALQQQLAVLQQQLAQVQQAQKPLLESKPEIPKEIASLKTPEELQTRFKQAEEVVDWAERVLDQSENLSATDTVVEIDGRAYTKAQVKEYMRDARKVKEKYIPAQLQELQAKAQREMVRQQWQSKADEELEWAKDEASDVRKLYEAIANGPVMKKIRDLVPEAVELDYVLKHAVNSMNGKRFHALTEKEAAETKKQMKVTPPGKVGGIAQGRGEAQVKQMKELESKVRTSGSYEDLVSLRVKQRTAKR